MDTFFCSEKQLQGSKQNNIKQTTIEQYFKRLKPCFILFSVLFPCFLTNLIYSHKRIWHMARPEVEKLRLPWQWEIFLDPHIAKTKVEKFESFFKDYYFLATKIKKYDTDSKWLRFFLKYFNLCCLLCQKFLNLASSIEKVLQLWTIRLTEFVNNIFLSVKISDIYVSVAVILTHLCIRFAFICTII